jgi:hypothetical protein
MSACIISIVVLVLFHPDAQSLIKCICDLGVVLYHGTRDPERFAAVHISSIYFCIIENELGVLDNRPEKS